MTSPTTTETVQFTINGRPVRAPKGWTILQAADAAGVRIPRLCFHPDLSLMGSCRVCVVDVKNTGQFMAACATPVADGMVVQTNSPEIRQARRDIVELLLDNHTKDCQTCERDGRCELQNLAYDLGVRERLFEGERKDFPVEASGASVVRESNKCVLCGRCVRVCAEVQGVCNLSQHGRGFHTVVTPAHGANMDDSVCIQCGQCVNVCPTAAFIEQDATEAVWAALADPNKHVVAQTAPSIRAAIGEGFGLPPGTPATRRMTASLRRLGFDAVFDTDFGADLTIVEESHEFLQRLAGHGPLPMLTSCSPGWVSFMEKFYPQLIPNASSCRSPMGMVSALAKTYYATKIGRDPKDIFMVAVMPCTAKKYEIRRPEHTLGGLPMTDASLTTREAVWMMKSFGLQELWTREEADFASSSEAAFDSPLGVSTGAGYIFGCTGGVMEAALRTAAAKLNGDDAPLEFTQVRAVEGLREATVRLGGRDLRVAVANGLTNARRVLDKVVRGQEQFHLIELMACPGGCIGGGGQPYPPRGFRVLDPKRLALRSRALYAIDGEKQLRRSHTNPGVLELYREFLGDIGGHKAHELLHTHYTARRPRGILRMHHGQI